MLLILITLMILSHIFLSPTTWSSISSSPFQLCSPQMDFFESPSVYLPAFQIWDFVSPVAFLSLKYFFQGHSAVCGLCPCTYYSVHLLRAPMCQASGTQGWLSQISVPRELTVLSSHDQGAPPGHQKTETKSRASERQRHWVGGKMFTSAYKHPTYLRDCFITSSLSCLGF